MATWNRFGTKEGVHLLTEVMKLGFEDRNTYTGDPVCNRLLVYA
jgi:gamma-glutamyltranspeptidase